MKPYVSSLKVWAPIIVGLAGLAASPALAASAPAQVAAGQKAFQYWCATCHSGTPGENGRPLPGTASLAVKYKGEKTAVLEERDDLVPAFTTFIIRHGSEGMPFFRKTEVSDQDMNDIAAYLARNVK